MRSTNTITPECFDCELWRAASALREGEPGPAAGRGGSCCRGTPVGKPLLCRFPPPPPPEKPQPTLEKRTLEKNKDGENGNGKRLGQISAGTEAGAEAHDLRPRAGGGGGRAPASARRPPGSLRPPLPHRSAGLPPPPRSRSAGPGPRQRAPSPG